MSIWATVDPLLDRTDDLAALRIHGLQLLAARRWRAIGRPVPPELLEDERAAAIATLAVPALLARVRTVVDGPLVLLKGPIVAARYPDPALRPSGDIDLLVPDAAAAERTLRESGFELAEGEQTSARQPHRPPLRWPTSPLRVEIHHSLPVPEWSSPPPADRLLATATPAVVGVDSILTLPPAHHAVLLAGHAWVHYGPRPRLRDLIDVALMADGVDPAELSAIAHEWGLHRVWATTMTAANALRRPSSALRGSPSRHARGSIAIRERTVAEEHATRWLGALWAPSWRIVPRALAMTVGRDLRPLPGESWSVKLPRMGWTLRNALMPMSERHRRS